MRLEAAALVAVMLGGSAVVFVLTRTKPHCGPPIDLRASPLASAASFRVDAPPPPPCAVGATCEAQLVVTALGDFHVNDDFPTRFIADPASEVAVEGPGAFTVCGETRGTMTVRYKPAKPGPATLVGTFKLGVCSDETCNTESPRIALRVTST